MFTAIQTNMNSTNGTTNYGFSGTTYDTHMMKNTEWGAVAYLSQSKYGKYGNTSYTGANKEIYQNKSSSYITGMSNGTPSSRTTKTQVAYNTADTGVGASTTGNISGIYDMSGGTYEYVMGNMLSSDGTTPEVGWNSTYTSGFTGKVYDFGNFTSVTGITFPSNKYYNKYTYGTSTDYTRGILGDATKEMSPASYKTWYSDTAAFVADYLSWFKRGGGGSLYNVTDAGVFNFNYDGGSADSYISGRVVIEP